jgi:phage shock protein C
MNTTEQNSGQTPHKKLYRSRTNRMLGGVCAGVGEYFDIDPTVIRIVWLLVVVFTGFVPGALVYLIMLLIVPEAPRA